MVKMLNMYNYMYNIISFTINVNKSNIATGTK
jgi:hypothetical protein